MTRRTLLLRLAAVVILTAQGIASYALRNNPVLPSPPPLAELPLRLGRWMQVVDEPVGTDVSDILGTDDTLSRRYQIAGKPASAELFVAYYKSQLRGKSAHDPKVCLPGAGWDPLESRVVQVLGTGTPNAVSVNYYVVAKDNDREVVLYWFQTHRGVYSSEQQLNMHRVLDAIRDNRTDMALVRVIVPVGKDGIGAATADALQFARLIYPEMAVYMPFRITGKPNV
jgi:EpsI family protein